LLGALWAPTRVRRREGKKKKRGERRGRRFSCFPPLWLRLSPSGVLERGEEKEGGKKKKGKEKEKGGGKSVGIRASRIVSLECAVIMAGMPRWRRGKGRRKERRKIFLPVIFLVWREKGGRKKGKKKVVG